jgi:hypothetical protein
MLKGLKKCLDSVVKDGYKKYEIGNFKVEDDGKFVYIYHYNNPVACIDVDCCRIAPHKKYWNYSQSTTRLCNDIIKYFDGYDIQQKEVKQ